jgi:NAD(P)-dependent dehydrogenase (short-subunit alcohol dehydrogenase family)
VANVYDFKDRRALVTGGAGGIGAAIVARLRDGGARVAVFDRRETRVCDLAIVGDVTQSRELDTAVEQIVEAWGTVDVLVCSAGIFGANAPTVETTDEEWARVHAVNASGVFYANRAVLPTMLEHSYGRIVNVASIAGKEGNARALAYASSKASVINLTKSIGRDVVGTGVLVNCIAPVLIDTPMLENVTEDERDRMAGLIPLGRLGTAGEVAALVAYLASEEMTFSTGACFDHSGGRAYF